MIKELLKSEFNLFNIFFEFLTLGHYVLKMLKLLSDLFWELNASIFKVLCGIGNSLSNIFWALNTSLEQFVLKLCDLLVYIISSRWNLHFCIAILFWLVFFIIVVLFRKDIEIKYGVFVKYVVMIISVLPMPILTRLLYFVVCFIWGSLPSVEELQLCYSSFFSESKLLAVEESNFLQGNSNPLQENSNAYFSNNNRPNNIPPQPPFCYNPKNVILQPPFYYNSNNVPPQPPVPSQPPV